MKNFLCVALCLGLALPMAASADELLSYTYLEGRYVDADGDAEGGALRGSWALNEQVYLFGGVAELSLDGAGRDLDYDLGEVGVGYRHAFGHQTHGLAELAYEHADTDFGDFSGYRAALGVRQAFGERWEGLGKVNYRDGKDFDGDFSATLGAQFKVNDTWGVVGDVEFGDHDQKVYTLGVRASF